MLVSFGLITSDWYSYVLVAQFVQVVVANPPIGSNFSFLLDVGQNHRFQRFLLAVRDNLEAQPARDKTSTMSASVLRMLTRRQIWIRAKSFLSWENLYHTDNKCLMVSPSSLPLCCTTDIRLVQLDGPLSTKIRSRPGRTIAARSLCNIKNAVS